MKKLMTLAIAFVLIAAAFSGCGSGNHSESNPPTTTAADIAEETTVAQFSTEEPTSQPVTTEPDTISPYEYATNGKRFYYEREESGFIATDPNGEEIVAYLP